MITHTQKILGNCWVQLGIILSLYIIFFYNTIFSMINVWINSETYIHGFLIYPISFLLIWGKRSQLLQIKSEPSQLYYWILLLLVCIWSLAYAVDVQVIQQFLFVLILPVLIASILGFKAVKLILFPLLYLLFAVPFGDFLIIPLQQITATITVWCIQLTSIPVYVDGFYISIPAGDFEVAEACSGIRYLIASFSLGTIYAYLTYSSITKRFIFIIFCIIVPIIANGLRAYGIILIAHLSDMKYATGADHLIHGWIFFGVIIFIQFFIGNYWADKPKIHEHQSIQKKNFKTQQNNLIPLLIVISILTISPLSVQYFSSQTKKPIAPISTIDMKNILWNKTKSSSTNWEPKYNEADFKTLISYQKEKSKLKLDVFFAYYQQQHQGKELISWGNSIYDKDSSILISQQTKTIQFEQEKIAIKSYEIKKGYQKQIIWQWYNVGRYNGVNTYKIKLIQLYNLIINEKKGDSIIAFSITNYTNTKQAEADLLDFINNFIPNLNQAIHNEK